MVVVVMVDWWWCGFGERWFCQHHRYHVLEGVLVFMLSNKRLNTFMILSEYFKCFFPISLMIFPWISLSYPLHPHHSPWPLVRQIPQCCGGGGSPNRIAFSLVLFGPLLTCVVPVKFPKDVVMVVMMVDWLIDNWAKNLDLSKIRAVCHNASSMIWVGVDVGVGTNLRPLIRTSHSEWEREWWLILWTYEFKNLFR